MAFSLSTQKEQVPKCCDLCETDTKIKWKCVNCDLHMCTKCKEKVHGKFKSGEQHKIIDIEEVGRHLEELDFTNIKCEEHDRQTCVMFCKSCDQQVCPLCMAEVHNGHKFVQISEDYKIQIENAKEIQIQIKGHIEELTNKVNKIKLLREDENSKYIETRNLIQAHNAALKREVDRYTDKLLKELDQKWETLKNSIDQEEQKVNNLKNRKEDQDTKVDYILHSRDADQVFKDSKQIGEFMKEAAEPVRLMDFTTMPKFLPGQITEYSIGSLQDIPKDLVINIRKQFTTDLDRVFFLSACPDNSLWIRNNNTLQKVIPEGSNLKVISNFSMKVYYIALTPSNDLLMSAQKPSTLQQISSSSGQVTDSVYDINPLLITTVHVTRDYQVMVAAKTRGPLYPADGRRVVIRMNKEGKHEKTYEHDRNKQPIFTNVFNITSTTNQTIFVVDKLSEDWRGRVVVLGQDGDVINTYTGHPKINSYNQPFLPVHAVATPLDNIIVTTLNNYYLYILNSVGNLITYYNIENIGILHPYSLNFPRSGQLYVGCTIGPDSIDKGKLYEVEITLI